LRPPSQAATAYAAPGSPAASVRLHAAVCSSRSGRGSSRCSGICASLAAREGSPASRGLIGPEWERSAGRPAAER
jgi:hypothetical protein